MPAAWNITRIRASGKREFGPAGDVLPASVAAEVRYSRPDVRVDLAAEFNGERMVLYALEVRGREVTPRLLSELTLSAVAQEVYRRTLTCGSIGSVEKRTRPTRARLSTELLHIATLYCREYAVGGNPREAVSEAWGIPRPTASRWLQMAHREYDLPGH